MRLKLYRAASTHAAMAMIRAEIGDDALILSTRKIAGGVEVAAAREETGEPAAPPRAEQDRAALAFHGVNSALIDRLTAAPLAISLAEMLRFAKLPLGPNAKPLLCVGPPGAGKTLTVARLATRLVLGGVQPLVITADGRRAGAAEQLASYTRLLGLDLVVASRPNALARALTRRRDGAPVLIDMPGMSGDAQADIAEFSLIAEATQAQAALVLPAGMDCDEAADIAAAFATAGATWLIATRLDVARRCGALLAAATAGLALAEFGIGPGAADGLEPAGPERLASLLGERKSTRSALQ